MSGDVFSPDGRYKVSFRSYEMRMSHSIDQPYLIQVSDNICLFDLKETVWSASAVRWLAGSIVVFDLRKYPGLVACTLTLDVETQRAQAISRTASVAGTFLVVKGWVMELS
ncbi:hypothetical protein BH09BAC4_BH09BAC4_23380 [soil metagenome]